MMLNSNAMTSAQHVGDRPGSGRCRRNSRLRFSQDCIADARRLFSEALGRYRDLHDVRGQAASLTGMGPACREPGHLTEVGIGHVPRIRGSVHLELGEYDEARADLEQSLAAYQRAGGRRGTALSLRSTGLTTHALLRCTSARQGADAVPPLHRSRGDAEAADAAFTHARSVFRARGAREYTEYGELPV
ncbi:tetratricopeptide repeat protein [Lentzea sp. NPDC055074]